MLECVESIHFKQKVSTTELETEYVEQRLSSCVFLFTRTGTFLTDNAR